jgi:hypothetical protein
MNKVRTDSVWKRTLAGRPIVGAQAHLERTTTMRDVEMFTAMTGIRCIMTRIWQLHRRSAA